MSLLEITLSVLLVVSFMVNFVFIKKARISKQEILSTVKNDQAIKGDGNISINVNSPQNSVNDPK